MSGRGVRNRDYDQGDLLRRYGYTINITGMTMDAWNRGWRQGALVGSLVTGLLLGGAVVFLLFIDWLGKCA